MNITRINLPTPKMGGKCFLLEDKGWFVLQEGAGVLRTIACTHAGSGSLMAFDGVPDENGFFPDENMSPDDPRYWTRNGKPIYRANPVVMGSWMTDSSFEYGLTIRATGGVESASAVATIVWLGFDEPKSVKKK